jgi:glycosyltransferase involved in cell wall biosynthesis
LQQFVGVGKTWKIIDFLCNKMFVSVVIPCGAPHVPFLANLIETLRRGTVVPDRIVIVVNGTEKEVEGNDGDRVKIVQNPQRMTSGAARNLGVQECGDDTDVVIFQDADDLPHPERVERIKNFFENNRDCVHLLHGYARAETEEEAQVNLWDDARVYSTAEILACNPSVSFTGQDSEQNLDPMFPPRGTKCHEFHHGMFAARRWVLLGTPFLDVHGGEDSNVNRRLLARYGKTAFLDLPLVFYFQIRSTTFHHQW